MLDIVKYDYDPIDDFFDQKFEGWEFVQSNGKIYNPNVHKELKSQTEVSNWLAGNKTHTVTAFLPDTYIFIDVDAKINERFLVDLDESGTMFQQTNRGIHVVQLKHTKTNRNYTTIAGQKAERLQKCIVAGQGYTRFVGANTNSVPWLSPLPKGKKSVVLEEVLEGERNNMTFKRVIGLDKLCENPGHTSRIGFLVNSFNLPPLSSIEVENIVKSVVNKLANSEDLTPAIEKLHQSLDPSGQFHNEDIISDQIIGKWNDTLAVDPSKNVYSYNGRFWERLTDYALIEMIRKACYLNPRASITHANFWERTLNTLKYKLPFLPLEDQDVTCFQNGALRMSSEGYVIKELFPLKKEYGNLHVIEIDADLTQIGQDIPDQVKSILQEMVGGPTGDDWGSLNGLRNLINKVVFNDVNSQIGVLLYGPPAVGKSTFIKCVLIPLVGIERCISVKFGQLLNPNYYHQLPNCRVLIFPEVSGDITPEMCEVFLAISGKDDLQVKALYKDPITVRFEGICLWTANLPLSGLGANLQTEQVYDRIMPISFSRRSSTPDSSFATLLGKPETLSSIVHWSLGLSPEIRDQTRCSHLLSKKDLDDCPYRLFVRVTLGVGGKVQAKMMQEAWANYASTSEVELPPWSKAKAKVFSTLRDGFEGNFDYVRDQNLRFYLGCHLKVTGSVEMIELPRISLFDRYDPWASYIPTLSADSEPFYPEPVPMSSMVTVDSETVAMPVPMTMPGLETVFRNDGWISPGENISVTQLAEFIEEMHELMPSEVVQRQSSNFQSIYNGWSEEQKQAFYRSYVWLASELGRLDVPSNLTMSFEQILDLLSLPPDDRMTLENEEGRNLIRSHWSQVLQTIGTFEKPEPYFLDGGRYLDLPQAINSLHCLCAIPLATVSRTNVSSLIRVQPILYKSTQELVDLELNPWYLCNRHMDQSLIPLFYSRNMTVKGLDYSRLNGFPGTNLGNIEKQFKNVILNWIQVNWKCKILKADYQGCHTRIAKGLLNRSMQTPELDLMLGGNLWENAIEHIAQLHPVAFKRYSKVKRSELKGMIKTAFYMALNGGKLDRHTKFKKVFGKHTDLYDDDVKFGLSLAIRGIPVFSELTKFNHLCLNKGRSLNLPTLTSETPSSYKATSRVLASLESLMLVQLVFGLKKRGFLVISLEHDGVLAIANPNCPLTQDELALEISSEISVYSQSLYNNCAQVEISPFED
jgi:hypothetical protein